MNWDKRFEEDNKFTYFNLDTYLNLLNATKLKTGLRVNFGSSVNITFSPMVFVNKLACYYDKVECFLLTNDFCIFYL